MASQHEEDVDVSSRAIFSIGCMYFYGTFGFGSPVTAFEYFEIAAQKGYPPAQFKLGYCYENGVGARDPDIEKAKYWYGEAAKQGNEYAIDALNRLNVIEKTSE